MTTPLERLPGLVPPPLHDFLQIAVSLGFTPILVGGAVRDLFLGCQEITDWDFELPHPQGSETRWQALLSALRASHRLSPQSHHVLKVQDPGTRLEWQFAPPRIETYQPRDTYGHGDFETKMAWALPFEQAVSRRDFTVNALGAQWDGKGWTLLDPLGGLVDLQGKKLRPCDAQHFRKDPVRFLRAHRFALKLGWSFSTLLSETLEQMDVSLLTAHYMGEEARKSGLPFDFWNRLQQQPTLPSKFQGGILKPQELQKTYQKYLTGFGHSNALLAAVFATGEGWHLLLPLGGKGESETNVWRHRREAILLLSGMVIADFIHEDELLLKQASFLTLCQLLKPPLAWMQFAWVRDVLEQHKLSWLTEKPWDEKIDVRAFPPAERALRKVMLWLRA